MFRSGVDTIQNIVERFRKAEDQYDFGQGVKELRELLMQIGVSGGSLLELEQRAYYLENHYSDRDTKQKMLEAKERVLAYVDQLMSADMAEMSLLTKVLDNFYFFLEALFERKPHRKGTIQKTQLDKLKIINEYDVQYLLYAYLKPIYPEARAEVSEDTGYHSVRVDIVINKDCVIEVKCTRQGLNVNKLLEEIEADMVHYGAKEIYFFIYDKEKRIDNPLAFKRSNENKIQNKKIHIIVHQPKIL